MSWRTVWPTILNLNNDWLVQVAVTMEMFKPVHVGSLSERKTSETARAVISQEWSSAAYRSEAIFTAHTIIMKRNKLKKAGSRSLWNLGSVVLYVMSCSFTVKSNYAHGFVQFFSQITSLMVIVQIGAGWLVQTLKIFYLGFSKRSVEKVNGEIHFYIRSPWESEPSLLLPSVHLKLMY